MSIIVTSPKGWTIPAFASRPEDYAIRPVLWITYKALVISALKTIDPTRFYGIAGLFLPNAEFRRHSGADFEPLPPVRAQPVFPVQVPVPMLAPGLGHTTRSSSSNDEPPIDHTWVARIMAAGEQHRSSIEQYRDDVACRKVEMQEHNKESQLANIFQIALYAGMPTDIQQTFMSAEGAIDMDTPPNMWRRYEEAIGPLTMEQLYTALAFMREQAYEPPNSVEAHIERLDAGITLKARAGFAFTEYDSVEILKANFSRCGLFALTIKMWAQQHPSMATQTYISLKTAIIRAAPDVLQQSSIGAGYAAGVTIPRTYAALQKALTEAEAKILAESEAKNASKSSTNNKSKGSSKPLRYCWTHGTGPHGSNECRGRKHGHMEDATYRNQMGGTPATSRK